jgi:threonine dehydrogenase-like Zn-dependent dehydrogenase
MKALAWHGKRDVRVDTVPDPSIELPTDAIIKVTSSGLCGSDLHLYEVLGPFLDAGDILGHEPMGIVEEVGAEVTHIKPGDRVVIPFNISCGHCFMCTQKQLMSQCETTQVREYGSGAAFLGYTKLYGQVPGGQAEYLRVPQAHFGPIKVPEGPADDRFLFLSDVLPTAWQAVQYTDTPGEGTILVIGLGPIGLMSARIAKHLGNRVIAIDLVPDRVARARRDGIEVFDLNNSDDIAAEIREVTDGRGPDAVIDAVGMEAHGSPGATVAQTAAGLLPDALARKVFTEAGIDRMEVINMATEMVMRGGTISLSGVYGGAQSPINLLRLFDKQVKIRMGQANVKRWVDDLMPMLEGSGDPLGVEDFASHHVPLAEAPDAYKAFQEKSDETFKVVFKPHG